MDSRTLWQAKFALFHPVGIVNLLFRGKDGFEAWDQRRCRRFHQQWGSSSIDDGLRSLYHVGIDSKLDIESVAEELAQNLRNEGQLQLSQLLKSHCRSYTWILYFLVRRCKPRIVVETGVAQGASSTAILQGLHDNDSGDLYSIEQSTQSEIGSLVPSYLNNHWKIVNGDSRVELPKLLKQIGGIDIFFHDSLHTRNHMIFEFASAAGSLRPGGCIIADNVECNDAFSNSFLNQKGWRAVEIKYSPEHRIGIALSCMPAKQPEGEHN